MLIHASDESRVVGIEMAFFILGNAPAKPETTSSGTDRNVATQSSDKSCLNVFFITDVELEYARNHRHQRVSDRSVEMLILFQCVVELQTQVLPRLIRYTERVVELAR